MLQALRITAALSIAHPNIISSHQPDALTLQVGRETELTVRFSTVVHERGSPETMRDVRGFSVKMYTNVGNWDFVGER